MAKTFTYNGTLSTALDYARWRLDDIDDQVTVDETKGPSPFLWDETYLSLISKFGVQRGMSMAASAIATRLSKDITSFGEAAGIRVSWADRDYYEDLAKVILQEPPWHEGTADDLITDSARVGLIKRGREQSGDATRYTDVAPAYPLSGRNYCTGGSRHRR